MPEGVFVAGDKSTMDKLTVKIPCPHKTTALSKMVSLTFYKRHDTGLVSWKETQKNMDA